MRIYHARAIYDFLDLLGDLGGIVEIFIVMFGALLFPISYHSYVVKAISRLFFVNANGDYFNPKEKHDFNPYDPRMLTMHQ